MSFPTAVVTVFRRYAQFTGRSGRPEFWWFVLFSVVMNVVADRLDASLFPSQVWDGTGGTGPLATIFVVVTFIPSLAVNVRRLHDTGRSGWWLLIWLIPVVGWIIAIYQCAQRGEAGPNLYGPPVTSSDPTPVTTG